MTANSTLRAVDIPVLLYLAEHPEASFAQLAEVLGVSTSTAHAARARLLTCGLAHRVAHARTEVAHGPLLEFLQHAVQYLFPLQSIPKARGIPTGLAAPVLADFARDLKLDDSIVANAPLQVWPSHLSGASEVGVGILPLIANAPSIAKLDPSLYRWLALVDVLRGGDARARAFARRVLPKLVETLP